MTNKVKQIFKNIFPNKLIIIIKALKLSLFDNYFTKSYSQEGEDMILRRIFEHKYDGFYVDIGAFHPKRFSNTQYFYKRGWRGINVDAMPGSMELFNKVRPRDINIERAISDKKEKLTYYIFNEPALNSFSKELSYNRLKCGQYYIVSEVDIETCTLKELLYCYMPNNQVIDFMTIDCEGLDIKILQSNDWCKYKPSVILIENTAGSICKIINTDIDILLTSNNYKLIGKTLYTLIYMHNNMCINDINK